MMFLKEWWRWFGRQSRLNKVIIVGFSASLVLFLVPLAVSWFKPTPIHVGVAFYTYERAFVLEGNTKAYFYENRNLVTDCSLRRIEQPLPKGRAKTPDPQSWVLIKFLLENVTDQRLTNLRLAIRSPLLRPSHDTVRDIESGSDWGMGHHGEGCPRLVCHLYTNYRINDLSGDQCEDSNRRDIASVYLYGPWSNDDPGALLVS